MANLILQLAIIDNLKKGVILMISKQRRLFTLASIVVLSIILTACGGSEEEAVGNEEGPIKIGVYAPTTGGAGSAGEDMVQGAELAIADINEEGGVLGRELELVVVDDASDPQEAVTAANKLVQEEISVAVGSYSTDAALPASGVYEEANIPNILVAANSHQIVDQGFDNIFIINGMLEDQAISVANYFDEENVEKIALVHDNSDYGSDLAELAREHHEELGGEVVAFEAIAPEEKDFGAVATKIKSVEPDATYFTGYYSEGGLLKKQFSQKDVPGLFVAGDANPIDAFTEISGEDAAKGLLVSETMSIQYVDSPEATRFIENYEEAYDDDPLIFGHRQYDGIRLAADAIERAESSTDSDAIIQQLSDTEDFEAFGEIYNFNEDGTRKDAEYMIVEVTEEGNERVY